MNSNTCKVKYKEKAMINTKVRMAFTTGGCKGEKAGNILFPKLGSGHMSIQFIVIFNIYTSVCEIFYTNEKLRVLF